MSLYDGLLWAHVFLFGFWLGSDLGTFLSSRYLMDPERDLPTRLAFAKAMMLFDLGPRVALILMLPLGLHLASIAWGLSLPTAGLVALWIVAMVWLWVMYRVHTGEGDPGVRGLRIGDTVLRVVLALGLVGAGIYATAANGGPFVGRWLGIKLLLFGLVIASGLGIRIFLPGFSAAFGAVVTEGSTPEREAALRRSLLRTYPFVAAIWVLVLSLGLVGVVKP